MPVVNYFLHMGVKILHEKPKLYNHRARCIFGGFTFLFFLLILRFGQLQLVQGQTLYLKALANRTREIPLEANRGIIYDRNFHELAISVNADAVFALPGDIRGSNREKEIAQNLAGILELDEQKVYEKITSNSPFVWLKFKVSADKSQQIKSLDLPGIGVTSRSQRFYPQKTLAAHVLGIAGMENKGLEGIEYFYDKELSGIQGILVAEADAQGHYIPDETKRLVPPQDGKSIVLTIDETIQLMAERELEKIMKEYQPKGATAIVMDVTTGEILALACQPTFDPNNYNNYPQEARRNLAVSYNYEPGSTFKIITVAAALEEKAVSLGDYFNCPGYIQVNGRTIRCSHNEVHGWQSLAKAMANSCNVSFVQIGGRLGWPKLYQYVRAFNFGNKTGIDLPGESQGILLPEKNNRPIDLATASIGQTNAVTPIQLLSAVSAIVNNGIYMKPHLVKAFADKDKNIIQEITPVASGPIVSKETSQAVRLLLEEVVKTGTGKNAQIEGYRVGGKTGTAQKIAPTGGYLPNEYVASFIGVVPIDNPRLAVLVVVDAPQRGLPYGGWVAAPAFKEIAREALKRLGVYPTTLEFQSDGQDTQVATVPNVLGLSGEEAVQKIKQAGLQPILQGNQNRVVNQYPSPGSKVVSTQPVFVNLSGRKEVTYNPQSKQVIVPDLTGKTVREAAQILGLLDLKIQIEGSGVAYKQDVAPGTYVREGAVITVSFRGVE